MSEQGHLPGEGRDDVTVQRRLLRARLGEPTGPRTGGQLPAPASAGGIVPRVSPGDDGDLSAALRTGATAGRHGSSVPVRCGLLLFLLLSLFLSLLLFLFLSLLLFPLLLLFLLLPTWSTSD